MTIHIMKGLSLVSPYPAGYLEKTRSLIVADLHLGIESMLASKGIQLPNNTFRETLDSVLIPAKEMKCKQVYILGDIKHNYGRLKGSDEWAIRRFVEQLRSSRVEPVLIRGNHDRHVAPILEELHVEVINGFVEQDGFILTHGHKEIRINEEQKGISAKPEGRDKHRIKAVIIGHDHPAVAIRDGPGGRREKFKAFLIVPGKKKSDPKVVVLPSVNPLAFGKAVNDKESANFLSPYLQDEKQIRLAETYLLEVGELLLPFPNISALGSMA